MIIENNSDICSEIDLFDLRKLKNHLILNKFDFKLIQINVINIDFFINFLNNSNFLKNCKNGKYFIIHTISLFIYIKIFS